MVARVQYWGGRMEEERRQGVWDRRVHSALFEMDNQVIFVDILASRKWSIIPFQCGIHLR